MPSYIPPKKNTAFIIYVTLSAQANATAFQSSPTLAAGDFKVSIDGGALANLATLPTVTPAAGKIVKISLSASEMNGDNICVIGSDAAGAEWRDIFINIQTSAQQVDDLSTQASVNTIDDFVDTEVAAIKAKTDNLPTDPADASDIAALFGTLNNISVANILAGVVEGSLTLQGVLRLLLAAETGKSTGGGTTSIAFRDNADSKNRIAATVNTSGNRTAVTLDAS